MGLLPTIRSGPDIKSAAMEEEGEDKDKNQEDEHPHCGLGGV